MTFRISGRKEGIGGRITEANAETALRIAAGWIDDGWINVTLMDEESGYVLDAKRVVGAVSAVTQNRS